MTLINVTFGYVGGEGGPDNHPPLFRGVGASQTITSAATSTQSSGSAGATTPGVGCAAIRLYSDVAIWYSVGADPAAVANTTQYLPAGGIEFIYAKLGDKIAVLVV